MEHPAGWDWKAYMTEPSEARLWHYPRWGGGLWRVRRKSAMTEHGHHQPHQCDPASLGSSPAAPRAAETTPADPSTEG